MAQLNKSMMTKASLMLKRSEIERHREEEVIRYKMFPTTTFYCLTRAKLFQYLLKIDLATIYKSISHSVVVCNHPSLYNYMSMFVLLAY